MTDTFGQYETQSFSSPQLYDESIGKLEPSAVEYENDQLEVFKWLVAQYLHPHSYNGQHNDTMAV